MSSFLLKILGILLMTIDHIGIMLYPANAYFRMLGRVAFPIFAFQTTESFKYTKSKEKYIWGLLIFTIISQIPYWLFLKTAVPSVDFSLNVGATLVIGSLCLYVLENIKNIPLKSLLVPLLIAFSYFIPMDYGFFGVIMIVMLYLFKDKKILSTSTFFLLIALYCYFKESVFELPALIALIPILLYNKRRGPKAKYLFYIFYPLHFLIILGIKLYIA